MTAIEFRQKIESLPKKQRLLIIKYLDNAFMEINRAECLLISLGVKPHNIPMLDDQYSLNVSIYQLKKVFDIEGFPELYSLLTNRS